jgi:hypothetical protein
MNALKPDGNLGSFPARNLMQASEFVNIFICIFLKSVEVAIQLLATPSRLR